MSCWREWDGWDMTCNECRQLASLQRIQRQQVQQPSSNIFSSSHNSDFAHINNIHDLDAAMRGSQEIEWPLPVKIICLVIFIWVLSLGDWAVAKLLFTLLKLAAYMIFGFWFGFSPADFGI